MNDMFQVSHENVEHCKTDDNDDDDSLVCGLLIDSAMTASLCSALDFYNSH